MNIELIEEIDKLINVLDNSDLIKRLDIVKENIYKDEELKKDLDEIKKYSDNIYSNEYKELNKKLFLNDNYKEFKKIEADVNFLILNINSKLKSIIDEKSCSDESY